jgi:hypothetical protein
MGGLSGSGRWARTGLNWIAAVTAGTALVLASILALVFAATVAMAVVLAGALFGLYALAVRAHRGARSEGPMVIEARKVGHQWVAYDWDRRAR